MVSGRIPSPQDVTVVVATRNESKHLTACVESLLASSRGRAELIFVDDASTDSSQEILNRYVSKIRLISGEGKGPGKARNLALRESNRPFVAFVDGDCRVADDWLDRLCEGFDADPQLAAVGGIQRESRDADVTERKIARFLQSVGFVSDYIHGGSSTVRVAHNPTCNVLYRRDALETVAGFDETLWPCEDLDLDLRLQEKNFHFLCTPAAVVEHRRPETWRGFFKMMRRYGFAHAQLVKKHGFCQKIHVLPLLLPILIFTVLFLGRIDPTKFIFLTGLILIVGWTMWRRINPLHLCAAVGCWLMGFYSGVLGTRRIAAHG